MRLLFLCLLMAAVLLMSGCGEEHGSSAVITVTPESTTVDPTRAILEDAWDRMDTTHQTTICDDVISYGVDTVTSIIVRDVHREVDSQTVSTFLKEKC